jgi:hypothetical protein
MGDGIFTTPAVSGGSGGGRSRQRSTGERGWPLKRVRAKAEAKLFGQSEGRARGRAATVARKTARAHNTPIYVLENGKVFAQKP